MQQQQQTPSKEVIRLSKELVRGNSAENSAEGKYARKYFRESGTRTPPTSNENIIIELPGSALDALEVTSYSVFSSLIRQRPSTAKNVALNVPQLIATLSLITCSGDHDASTVLRKHLLKEEDPLLPVPVRQCFADYLRIWDKSLQKDSKPGGFFWARRVLVHNHFTKSYSYNMFMALSSHSFEVKIVNPLDCKEVVSWIQRDAHLADVRKVPFELWKIISESTSKRDLEMMRANHKCPIIACISNLELSLPCGTLGTDAYTIDFTFPNGNVLPVAGCKVSTDKPDTMCYVEKDNHVVIKMPSASNAFAVYVITNVDASKADAQSIAELVHAIPLATKEKVHMLQTMYLPVWDSDFNSLAINLAQGIKDGIDGADAVFKYEGFGDLAMEFSAISAQSSSSLVPSIQHFDCISIQHAPEAKPNAKFKVAKERDALSMVIRQPFVLAVVDVVRAMPLALLFVSDPICYSMLSDPVKMDPKPAKKFCSIL